MPYYVGIDLGTTYTAAAVWRDERVEIATLGTRAAVVPSVVLLRDDGTVLVGEAAERRALTEPQRVAREFKRRFGDPTPIIVGGTPYSADSLSAKLLRWVVDAVTEREGAPPDSVVVSHPANWGPFKQDLLRQTFRLADLDDVSTISEPEAAAIHYASQERVEPGATIAIYDLGGGTFDAAVLRRTDDGWEILGDPEGVEHLGGVDFDQAVLRHVEESIGKEMLEALDPDDPGAMAAVSRLRQECVEAKEALSSDVDVTIPVLLPNLQTDVRLTRSELETMVRPTLADSIGALRRAVRSAGVDPEEVDSVLLVGGSSRLPLVAQLVSSELRRPVAVDAHPKHGVALGAAIVAAERGQGRAVNTEVVPSIEVMNPAVDIAEPRLDVSQQLSRLPDIERRPPPADPVPPGPVHQRVTVPAPPARPASTQGEAPRRQPPPPVAPRTPQPGTRPPQRHGAPPGKRRDTSRIAFGLLLIAILGVAGVGAYWIANRDTDSGNADDGIDSTTADETTSVAVDAAAEETDSGIVLAERETVTISAEGEIRDDVNGFPDRFFSPEGEPDPEGAHAGDPFAGEFNHAALLGQVGDGEVFLVGDGTTFTVTDTGSLVFFVNDSGFDDNDGTFAVDVTVTPS